MRWEPVSGKLVLQEWDNLATGWAVYDDGATLLVSTDAGSGEYKLPAALRLCRQVPDSEGERVPVEAITDWIDNAALPYGLSDDEVDYFMSQKRVVRAWLDTLAKGGE